METLKKKWDRIFCAVAFAEEGEFATARELLRDEQRPQTRDRVSTADAQRPQMRAPGIKR